MTQQHAEPFSELLQSEDIAFGKTIVLPNFELRRL